MKHGLIFALAVLASTAISCTGTLWSHDTVLPDSTLNAQYYGTAVVSVGTDNRPAVLAQRSIVIEQPDGVSSQFDIYRQELVLLRTDAAGQLTQSFILNQSNQLNYSQMYLQPTSDGGFIALHTTVNEIATWQLLKISPSGAVAWRKPFDPFPAGPRILSMLVNQAGDIFTCGYYFRSPGGPLACIAKLNPQGETVWAKSYPDLPGNGSYGYTLTLTPEGGCVLSGPLFTAGVGDQNSFLLKTDADGGVVWSKTYRMPGITAHLPVADGYLLTGQTNTAAGFTIYLSKTFQDGTSQWYRDNLLTGFYNMPVYLFADKDRYTVLGNGSTPLPTPGNGFLWAQFDGSGNPLGRVVSTAFSGPNVNERVRFQNVADWTTNGYLTVSNQQAESEGIKLALVGYDGQPKWVSVVAKSVRFR